MNVPCRWLDILVVLCVIASPTFGLLTVVRSPDLLRGRFKFLGTLSLGLALLLGGADSLLTLHYAPRSTSNGTISELTNHGGKPLRATSQFATRNKPSPFSQAASPATASMRATR